MNIIVNIYNKINVDRCCYCRPCCKNTQEQWNTFDNIIKEIETQHVPTKIYSSGLNNKFRETLPKHIRQLIKKKHKLWKSYMKKKEQSTFKEYCVVRNKVKFEISQSRINKEMKISNEIKTNPKGF